MQIIVVILTLVEAVKLSAEENSCGTERYSIYTSQDDALCYWNKNRDHLPLLEENNRIDEAIYFIDASCKGGLNVREACSVEAAAKVNPTRRVNVLFAGPVTKECLISEPLASLHHYGNVYLKRIYVDEFVNNTGFRHSLKSSVINEGPYPNLYALDLLKFITLYKFSGIYMDLDIMATRPFDELPKSKNWVGVEDHTQKSLSTAILAASSDSVGRKFITSVIRVLRSGMDSDDWSFENFNVLRAAVERVYGRIPFEKTKNGCSFSQHGLVLYASKFFFPIQCEYSEHYFDSNLDIEVLTKSFTQKICNGMTYQDTVTENCVYAQLMSKYCPRVYEYFVSIEFNETDSNPKVTVDNTIS